MWWLLPHHQHNRVIIINTPSSIHHHQHTIIINTPSSIHNHRHPNKQEAAIARFMSLLHAYQVPLGYQPAQQGVPAAAIVLGPMEPSRMLWGMATAGVQYPLGRKKKGKGKGKGEAIAWHLERGLCGFSVFECIWSSMWYPCKHTRDTYHTHTHTVFTHPYSPIPTPPTPTLTPTPTDTVAPIARLAAANAHLMRTQGLSNCTWALSKLVDHYDDVGDCLDVLATYVMENIQDMEPQHLSNVVLAWGHLERCVYRKRVGDGV